MIDFGNHQMKIIGVLLVFLACFPAFNWSQGAFEIETTPIFLNSDAFQPKDETRVPFLAQNSLLSNIQSLVWCDILEEEDPAQKILALTESSLLFFTGDGGISWMNLSFEFAGRKDGDQGNVRKIIQSSSNKGQLIFIGFQGVSWVTKDCGDSYSELATGRPLDDFAFHPVNPEWVLASAFLPCLENERCDTRKELFLSKNFLNEQNKTTSWMLLGCEGVETFAWGIPEPDPASSLILGSNSPDSEPIEQDESSEIPMERILATVHVKSKEKGKEEGEPFTDLVVSDDFFQTSKVIAPFGINFAIFPKYLFVIKLSSLANPQVEMEISPSQMRNYQFENTILPIEITSKYGYTLLDTQEEQLFMSVNHFTADGEVVGYLYKSDSRGVKYTLVLKNCVRSQMGLVDFERVKGVEGIYIVNVYDKSKMDSVKNDLLPGEQNDPSLNENYDPRNPFSIKQSDLQKYKKTVVSFDKGVKWHYLKAPRTDSEGRQFSCPDEFCSLHIHSYSSNGFYTRLYSSESSLGLLIGNGNVGYHLSYRRDQIHTFMSRDGGLNWFAAREGSHMFAFGNHGGIIVMATDQEATDHVYYSLNEGLTWEKFVVSDEPFEMTGLEAGPKNTGLQFLLLGKQGEEGKAIYLDFSGVIQNECIDKDNPDSQVSDFEIWIPQASLNNLCLMGRRVKYVRRKRENNCAIGPSVQKPVYVESCPCTEEDWECETGYEKKGRKCLQIKTEVSLANIPPLNCSGFYEFHNGYRKISGNSCEGGLELSAMIPCPSKFSFFLILELLGVVLGGFFVTWLVFRVLLPLIFYILRRTKEFLLSQIEKIKPVTFKESEKDFGSFMSKNSSNTEGQFDNESESRGLLLDDPGEII